MAPEEQAFHLRMSNPSEDPEAPPLNKDYEERQRDYPNNDLFIN
jgi:uncharacterized protein YihD (DUF1040 family)